MGFQKENIVIRFVASSLSFIRDFTKIIVESFEKLLPFVDLSDLTDLVTVSTYYIQMLIYFMKAVVDLNRITLERSVPSMVLFDVLGFDSMGLGFIVSLFENTAKGIRAIIKGAGLETITDSLEKKMRITFAVSDILEDFLIIVYPDIIRYN